MKYLYFGLGLLAATLAISLVCLWQLADRSQWIAAQLEAAVAACDAGDYSRAYEAAGESEKLWKKNESFICSLLDHMETDNINRGLSNLRSYMRTGTTEEFRASCAEVLVMVRHLAEMERPYLHNLL